MRQYRGQPGDRGAEAPYVAGSVHFQMISCTPQEAGCGRRSNPAYPSQARPRRPMIPPSVPTDRGQPGTDDRASREVS